MTIHYIPNDPAVGPLRRVKAYPKRRRDALLKGPGGYSERLYAPGSKGFTVWQCREAALRGLACWEEMFGSLRRWARNKTLRMRPFQRFQQLGAYDRAYLSFSMLGDGPTFAAASADAVTHELGHALLDTVRPDLWREVALESQALHEAFADAFACTASLADRDVRRAVLSKSPDIGSPNLVEAMGESLAEAIRQARQRGEAYAENVSGPRRLLNTHRATSLPHEELPADGPPNVLVATPHSYSQVLSGAFYDLLRFALAHHPAPTEGQLWDATKGAFGLLVEGLQSDLRPRTFAELGRAMLAVGQRRSGWATWVVLAFARHGITLDPGSVPMPASITGGPSFGRGARRRLLHAWGFVGDTPSRSSRVEIGGHPGVHIALRRHVPVRGGPNGKKLWVPVRDALLVSLKGRPTVIGETPNPSRIESAVQADVRRLLRSGAVARGRTSPRRPCSFYLRTRRARRYLRRVRFLCT